MEWNLSDLDDGGGVDQLNEPIQAKRRRSQKRARDSEKNRQQARCVSAVAVVSVKRLMIRLG